MSLDKKKPESLVLIRFSGLIRTSLDFFGSGYGGGGGNRTRVRKLSAVGSTCVAGLLF